MCASSQTQRDAASFEEGARARLATSAKSTRSAACVAALSFQQAAQGRIDPQASPEAVERVAPAQRARAEEVEALGGGERGCPGDPRARLRGSARASPRGARGRPCSRRPRGRSCRAPRCASASSRGPRRCARAAGSGRPSRPCCAAVSCAHTWTRRSHEERAKTSTPTLNVYLCFLAVLTRPKRCVQGFSLQTWARGAISCGTPVMDHAEASCRQVVGSSGNSPSPSISLSSAAGPDDEPGAESGHRVSRSRPYRTEARYVAREESRLVGQACAAGSCSERRPSRWRRTAPRRSRASSCPRG